VRSLPLPYHGEGTFLKAQSDQWARLCPARVPAEWAALRLSEAQTARPPGRPDGPSETVWAARRMVARKMDRARRSIEKTLAQWGAPAIDVADLDPAQLEDQTGPLARLANLSGPPGS
jgi:hypothetical protein